jgi:ethanolamine utilization protein EutN
MWLGRIEGKIWASVKDDKFEGIPLSIMQPLDEYQQPMGPHIVAVDGISVREGDLVFWVNSTEASFVFPHQQIPTEAGIVGLVDELDVIEPESGD